MQSPFVLASASPRRRELLSQLGLAFEVRPAHVDESRMPGEAPAAYVRRVASDKARAVADALGRARPILAADTTVVVGDRVLGKPADPTEARDMLALLGGRVHEVMTGLALAAGGEVRERVVLTRVRFRPLTSAEIGWYVGTGEPFDAAGAYKIQARAGAFVASIEGSHSNVIGLPLSETLSLLAEGGVALPWEDPT